MPTNNCRIKHYRVTYDGFTELREFTQAQADSIGAILELDGIGINSAVKLINLWNMNGGVYKYSIPFVKLKGD